MEKITLVVQTTKGARCEKVKEHTEARLTCNKSTLRPERFARSDCGSGREERELEKPCRW